MVSPPLPNTPELRSKMMVLQKNDLFVLHFCYKLVIFLPPALSSGSKRATEKKKWNKEMKKLTKQLGYCLNFKLGKCSSVFAKI